MSIFKEAKASYGEKKAQIKAEKALQRSQTFDQSKSLHRQPTEPGYDQDDHRPQLPSRAQSYYYANDDEYSLHDRPRRRSYDVNSVASSSRRSHNHHHRHGTSRSSRHHSHRTEQPPPTSRSVALTEKNLKTHSESSSTRPSKPPTTQRYKSPYAETLPSRMDLTQADMRSVAPTARQSAMVPRTRSESELRLAHHRKEPDMNLAYGNVPPDLKYRIEIGRAHV